MSVKGKRISNKSWKTFVRLSAEINSRKIMLGTARVIRADGRHYSQVMHIVVRSVFIKTFKYTYYPYDPIGDMMKSTEIQLNGQDE